MKTTELCNRVTSTSACKQSVFPGIKQMIIIVYRKVKIWHLFFSIWSIYVKIPFLHSAFSGKYIKLNLILL